MNKVVVVQVVAYTSADLVQGYYTASTFSATTADQVLSSNGIANKAIMSFITAHLLWNSCNGGFGNQQWF